MNPLRQVFCNDICDKIDQELMKIYKTEWIILFKRLLKDPIYFVSSHIFVWNHPKNRIKLAIFAVELNKRRNEYAYIKYMDDIMRNSREYQFGISSYFDK
jgi:hypothetical protein